MALTSDTAIQNAILALLVGAVNESGEIKTTAVLNGNVTIDLAATNALLTTMDADTSALAAIISGGKLLTTETSAAAIKTAVEALAAIISGGKLLTTETSAAAIKTAVEATKIAIDTINTNIATIASDIAIIKASNAVKVVTAANTGTGNGSAQALSGIGTGTYFSISNEGNATLTFTIGGVTVSVGSGDTFGDDFASFSSVSVTAASNQTYNWVVKA